MTSPQKNPDPPTKNCFSSANYKICWVFCAFDQVCSACRTRENLAQSHVLSGCFCTNCLNQLRCETLWVPGGFPTAISMGTGRSTFKARKSHCVDRALQHLLFASLVVQMEKQIWLWVWGFLWVMSQWGHIFAPVAEFTCPWAPTNGSHFWLIFFLEFRLSSKFLKPLNGLVAYLETKLWLQNQK